MTPEIKELLDRLDRIEQLLRELGQCWDCGLAHRRGQTACEEPPVLRVV